MTMKNEIMEMKYIKQIKKQGVNKTIAKEIVEVAMETSKGKNIEMFIDYAMKLRVGFNFIAEVKNYCIRES